MYFLKLPHFPRLPLGLGKAWEFSFFSKQKNIRNIVKNLLPIDFGYDIMLNGLFI